MKITAIQAKPKVLIELEPDEVEILHQVYLRLGGPRSDSHGWELFMASSDHAEIVKMRDFLRKLGLEVAACSLPKVTP